MKKVILLAALCLCSTTLLWAQQKPLAKFFNKYQSDTSFTIVDISPKMFRLFAQMSSDSANQQTDEVMNIAKKLTGLRIITKDHPANSIKLFKEADGLLSGKSYENLMTVRDDGDHVKFLINQGNDGVIHHLIMLVGGNDEFVALSLSGDINLSDISKIAGSMDIHGFNNLKDLKNLHKHH
jgi:hypothetical protein